MLILTTFPTVLLSCKHTVQFVLIGISFTFQVSHHNINSVKIPWPNDTVKWWTVLCLIYATKFAEVICLQTAYREEFSTTANIFSSCFPKSHLWHSPRIGKMFKKERKKKERRKRTAWKVKIVAAVDTRHCF